MTAESSEDLTASRTEGRMTKTTTEPRSREGRLQEFIVRDSRIGMIDRLWSS